MSWVASKSLTESGFELKAWNSKSLHLTSVLQEREASSGPELWESRGQRGSQGGGGSEWGVGAATAASARSLGGSQSPGLLLWEVETRLDVAHRRLTASLCFQTTRTPGSSASSWASASRASSSWRCVCPATSASSSESRAPAAPECGVGRNLPSHLTACSPVAQ